MIAGRVDGANTARPALVAAHHHDRRGSSLRVRQIRRKIFDTHLVSSRRGPPCACAPGTSPVVHVERRRNRQHRRASIVAGGRTSGDEYGLLLRTPAHIRTNTRSTGIVVPN